NYLRLVYFILLLLLPSRITLFPYTTLFRSNEREQSFFTEMKESDLLLDYKTSAHFSLESQIKPIKDNIYNIVITEEQSAEQTSNYKNMKTYTINLDEEEFIHFEDII